MNLFLFAFKVTKCITSLIFLYFIRSFTNSFHKLLTRLSLIKEPAESTFNSDDFHPTGYVLLRYISSGAVVPVTVQELTSLIKKRLPAVEYGEYIAKKAPENYDGEGLCSVCLGCIEEREEVRELLNCCHVFHRDCLDSWVDVGQVTCPVCRSLLYPASTEAIPVYDISDVTRAII